MMKTQTVLMITFRSRNALNKPTFRNFSQRIYSSKTNAYSCFFGNKYMFQLTSILNTAQRSKFTNSPLIKEPPLIPDSFLDGVAGIDDVERKEEIFTIVKLLLYHGCSEEEIKTKCLPVIISTQSSYQKVKLLTELHSNIIILLPLLSCHIVSLKMAAKHSHHDNKVIGFPNRIEYLAHNFEINLVELIPLLSKHPSLLTMPFQRLKDKMKILQDAEISSEYIVKDLWIFNYNEKLLEKRCFAACEANVELKPWMLRCSEKFFESMLTKWEQTEDILKGDDELSYLAKKLDCSEDYVKVMMEKNKLLKTINIPKIEKVITFLKEKGYSSQEIRLFPRVFCSSVQTLSKRFEELYDDENPTILPTLSRLCTSSKVFQDTQTKKISSKKKEDELKKSN